MNELSAWIRSERLVLTEPVHLDISGLKHLTLRYLRVNKGGFCAFRAVRESILVKLRLTRISTLTDHQFTEN